MGLSFRKSVTLCKGVKLNIGNKSSSISVGTKGIHQSLSTSGRTTTTLSLPGTGLSYSKSVNVKKLAKKVTDKVSGKETDKKTSSKSSKASSKDAKIAAKQEQEAALEAQNNQTQLEEYNAYVQNIRSIHVNCDAYTDWTKENTELAAGVLGGDAQSYLQAVQERGIFDDLLDYGTEFEVGTDSGEYLEVEFKVKAGDVVPDYTLSMLASGKLSKKDMAKGAYQELVQDYVCSAVIRTARDTFALLPVKKAVIHAVDSSLNTATGYEEERTIVSVVFDRDRFLMLNFQGIDPSDALSSFPCHMNFKKTAGFSAVERLQA